jgi:FimV-like protein
MAAGFSSYDDAVRFTDQALGLAHSTRNRALVPFLLQNLGVAHRGLGNRRAAVDYYRQSAALFNELGDEQRAAELQANSAAMLIEFGGDPDVGLRGVQMALGVSRNRGNRPFEVFALQVSAAYYRNAGRHRLAEEQLNLALSISRQQNLTDRIPSLTLDLARSLIETGEYIRARELVQEVIATHTGASAKAGQRQAGGTDPVRISGREHAEAAIRLALTDARLGDVAAARAHLASIAAALDVDADPALRILFPAAAGEVEYEAGNLAPARAQFQRTAALWEKELPHARTVEALGFVAFLDALASKGVRGVDRLEEVLAQAREMGRVGLEARVRIFLARAALLRGSPDEARRYLDDVPPDADDRVIGPELRAQVHYWRGQVLRAGGDAAAGAAASAEARRLLDGLRSKLPPERRAPFSARTDIRPILE